MSLVKVTGESGLQGVEFLVGTGSFYSFIPSELGEALLGDTPFEEFGLSVDHVNHTKVPIFLKLLGFSPEEHVY